MSIIEYLKGYLAENPSSEAAVPGLGIFYAAEKAGRRCIQFKEELPTGKAFLHYIAFKENCTAEQVKVEMEQWVRGISHELKSQRKVELEGVGIFSIDESEGRVTFSPVWGNSQAPDENFGLENQAEERHTSDSENLAFEPVAAEPTPTAEAPAIETPTSEASAPRRPVQTSVSVPAGPRPVREQGSREQGAREQGPREQGPREQGSREQGAREQGRNSSGNRVRGQSAKPVSRPNNRQSSKQFNRQGDGPGVADREPLFAPNNRPARPSGTVPFYSRWWFILICVSVVLAALAFSLTPVRERLLGGTDKVPGEMLRPEADDEILEENIELFGEGDMEMSDEFERGNEEAAPPAAKSDVKPAAKSEADHKAKPEADHKAKSEADHKAKPEAKPAADPKARQETKSETKPETKPSPKPLAESRSTAKSEPKPEPKSEPKSTPKPEAKAEAKPAPAGAAKDEVSIDKPQAGKFYLIVGSFGVKENARKKADELKAMGMNPVLLFVEAKGLYYVSLKTCADRESAVAARSDIRDNRKMECWIYAAN